MSAGASGAAASGADGGATSDIGAGAGDGTAGAGGGRASGALAGGAGGVAASKTSGAANGAGCTAVSRVHPWLPEGMDPKSSYFLEIKPYGNPKKSRKEFDCFVVDKVLDSDRTNLKDFVDWLEEKYPLGYGEIAHVH
ncbi:hypothetical protein BAE44_0013419 [Dichanthelium oligosanthes]|uniref:Uncharacterized protein n=1 Tax=Dichanthelium oligosanthes TaxID=888268 RepID=A0A1E5VKG0_9POAL|nr:hypothetical protein BAE44_0013419 [Dichanthelium oligosanthes]